MKGVIKKTMALALFGIACAWGASAHALPISGQFSLFNDAGAESFLPGELLFLGSFESRDRVSGTQYEDITTGIFYDQVRLSSINAVDQTGSLLDFELPAQNGAVFAVLDNADPSRVLGFSGRIVDRTARPGGGQLFFTGPRINPLTGQLTSTFSVNARGATFSSDIRESGIQQVPEPAGIALLGAGIAVLGFARRRKLKAA